MKYLDIKEKLALPIFFCKACCTFCIAYAVGSTPTISGAFKRKPEVFVLEKLTPTRRMIVILGPSLVLITMFIGAVVQMYGKYWYIWMWLTIYLSFLFDYIWLDEGEEEVFLSNWESLKDSKEEEEKEEDTE